MFSGKSPFCDHRIPASLLAQPRNSATIRLRPRRFWRRPASRSPGQIRSQLPNPRLGTSTLTILLYAYFTYESAADWAGWPGYVTCARSGGGLGAARLAPGDLGPGLSGTLVHEWFLPFVLCDPRHGELFPLCNLLLPTVHHASQHPLLRQ